MIKYLKLLFLVSILFISNTFFYSKEQLEISDKLKNDIDNIIKKYFLIKDTRQIHIKDTDEVTSYFYESFRNKYFNMKKNNDNLRRKGFDLLYKSSKNSFEDSSDYYYSTLTQVISFAGISMSSDEDRKYSFIEYAKMLINHKEDFEDYYLILLLIDFIYEIEDGNIKGWNRKYNIINEYYNNLIKKAKKENIFLYDINKIINDLYKLR